MPGRWHPLRGGARERRRIGGFGEAFRCRTGVDDVVMAPNDLSVGLLGQIGRARDRTEAKAASGPQEASSSTLEATRSSCSGVRKGWIGRQRISFESCSACGKSPGP